MTSAAEVVRCPPELCVVNPPVGNALDVIRLLATVAHTNGYVDEAFEAAVLAREEEHPTGLPTALPAAIPHADPIHVHRPGFVAALLDPPVSFKQMGTPDTTVAVRLVVMLLVTDPGSQVKLLGRIIQAFQDPRLGHRLDAVKTPLDLSTILNATLVA